ncbi:MAG: HD-GYP domain-containing protein [Lachnospira sp.]
MNMKIRKSGKYVSYREIFLCPYEDRLLALCVKLVFGFVWLINMLVGIVLDVGYEYDIQAALIVLIMAVNIAISVKNYNIWIDFVTFAIMSMPVYSLLFDADIEAFSIMYPVLFLCATVFVLGIKYSLPINIVCLGSIIYCCRFNNADTIDIYDENIVLRLPYFFICMLLIIYCLMFFIQKNWVEKKNIKHKLENRIYEENIRLENISMKVMNTMVHALGAKIYGEEEHLKQVAEYAREIALRKGLDHKMCMNAYNAGLLHEIGMAAIPDELINKNKLSDEEYDIFKTYVDKGYEIVGMLRTSSAESIAEAVHYHRENYDGSGYPSGLKKSEIPLLARIIMVADYTDRHLRRGESSQIVIRKLRTLSGYKFDPADARIMENILNESNQ